jgi:alkylation response protein AidB-like acyl-CoA dehydrogenase
LFTGETGRIVRQRPRDCPMDSCHLRNDDVRVPTAWAIGHFDTMQNNV